jgi:outer membrane protein assembly factor BamB
MESGSTTSSRCPTCGAPIGDVERPRCEYCGAAINAPVAAAKAAAQQVEKATRSAWRRSWIYVVGILAFSAVMRIVAQRNAVDTVRKATQAAQLAPPFGKGPRSPEREPLLISALLATVPDDGGKLSLLFATTRPPDFPIVLLDAATSTVRWKNGPYSTYVHKAQLAVLGAKLYIAAGSRLTALDMRDGGVLWQASLAVDAMEFAEAVRAAGERVAVLERDGTTQVFDANSGKTAWAHKWTPPPHYLQGVGDALVGFEEVKEKRGARDEIVVVDLATGEERHRLRPHCSSHSIMPVQTPGWTAPLWLAPDRQALYVTYGDFRFCVDGFDLRTGALSWQLNRPIQGETLRSVQTKSALVLGDELLLYGASDNGIYALSRSKGELRKVLGDSEQVLAPAFVQGDLLVATAVPNWEHADCANAKKCALWGVDLAKGSVLWRYALPADGRVGNHDLGDRIACVFGPDGLTLVMPAAKDNLVVDKVDRTSGVVKSHQSTKLVGEIRHFELAGDLIWVDAREFVGVDARTGAIRYRFE